MKALREILGDRLLTDPDMCAGFAVDWTGRYSGPVLAVARPNTTQEVSDILRICDDQHIPVVPQGGNTGLVGGSVPHEPSVVLSTRGLDEVGDIDPITKQVTVGAGVTLAELQRIAHDAGCEYGVDLGARESATIGGTVATNAGGINVVAYGMTRRQVVGVEAVLANGDVVSSLRGLAKDNTGYDLPQLFCGSEGTLGVITKVRLQLQPAWNDTTTAMLGVETYADAIALMQRVADTGARIKAAEIFDWFGVELASRHTATIPPLMERSALVLLMEYSGDVVLPDNAVVAVDGRDRKRLWSLRESLPELISREGVVHKLDIAVVPALLDVLAKRTHEILQADSVRSRLLFGHLLDGNLHVAYVGPEADDTALQDALLAVVADLHGTISAEHGVGVQKAHALQLSRSSAEIAAMRAIKHALDPHGIMNPGVIFE